MTTKLTCHLKRKLMAATIMVLGMAALLPSRTLAQYTLGASDAGGTCSLTGTTNWFPSGALAPTNTAAASDTYTVPSGSFTLRTPTGAASYTVYGTIIMNGGAIGAKGYGGITYENLQLNGGGLYNSGTSGPLGGQNNAFVYGFINLTASSQIRPDGAGTTNFIYALITNSPSISPVPTLTFNTGGTIVLEATNTFTGNITIDNNTPSTLFQLGTNNATPATVTLQLDGGSTSGNTPPVFDLNGYSTTIANLIFTSGTIETGYVTNSAAGKTSTLTIGYGNPSSYTMNYGTFADNPTIAGTLALAKTGTSTYTLNTADTYHGSTTISNGTLALGGSGSINNSSAISIAAGATFDVSALSSYTLSGSTALNASGTGTTMGVNAAAINGSSTVSLGAQPINLTYAPATFNGDPNDAALLVSQGDLTLNNNAFTVNNASGTPLGAGAYLLIQVNDGNINQSGSPAYALTVTGSGLAAQTTSAIQVSGGSVNLVVTANANPTPVFSNLTPSQNVAYGTANVTLSGNLKSGSIFPANGEPVTVSINGNVQATTINDSTGDFSISYSLSGIPASATPYTITYSYNGDASLGSAVNTGTTLTVQPATPAFSGLTASQTISYGTAGVTLGGKVSAGSVYPAIGETVTVSIDGNPQNTTINDSMGDFSLSYNLSSIPFGASAYPITYSYGGDGSLDSAEDTSTTLTIETNTITENLTISDAVDFSSLDSASSWTPATTVFPTSPSATNYDFITDTTLRTPPGSADYGVDANSLTIGPTGFLVFKGNGTVTIPNLILNGGALKNAGTGGTPDESLLAGSINLTASSSLTPDALSTSIVNIESVITNAAGISPTLTCSGGGTVILSAQNTFNGKIVVTGVSGVNTILQLGTNNALPEGTSVTLNGGAGTTAAGVLDLNGFSTTITNLTFSSTEPNYGYVTNSAFGTTGTLTLGNSNTTEILQYGSLVDDPGSAGTVALAKIGTGTLTLTTENPYYGNTTISAGTLALGSGGSIPNSAEISVATNATFDVSQIYFDLGTSQTLTGGGTVNGAVQADGTISPAGTLTFNGGLTFDGNLTFTVNTSRAQSNDFVNVINGGLNNTGTGTLTVSNLGPLLVVGDTFTLFNQPLNNGDNLSIIPPAGVTLTNNLSLNGTLTVLSVTPVTPPQPGITGISLSGTSLVISGTNGVAGEQYHLLTSTNVALPLGQWTVLPANTFNDSNFSITNTVNPSARQNYYILRVP
jgi:fibronectin-binding autotransporter adhesin